MAKLLGSPVPIFNPEEQRHRGPGAAIMYGGALPAALIHRLMGEFQLNYQLDSAQDSW